jgi:hypothetical protein
MKELKQILDPDKKCLGLIAQEVELIIPDTVSVN